MVPVSRGHQRSERTALDQEEVANPKIGFRPSQGVGSTWETTWRAFGLRLHAVVTRAECIPNKRVVDRASTGVTWANTNEQKPTGTTLSLAFAITTRMPLADKALNRVFSSQERQLNKNAGQLQRGAPSLT